MERPHPEESPSQMSESAGGPNNRSGSGVPSMTSASPDATHPRCVPAAQHNENSLSASLPHSARFGAGAVYMLIMDLRRFRRAARLNRSAGSKRLV